MWKNLCVSILAGVSVWWITVHGLEPWLASLTPARIVSGLATPTAQVSAAGAVPSTPIAATAPAPPTAAPAPSAAIPLPPTTPPKPAPPTATPLPPTAPPRPVAPPATEVPMPIAAPLACNQERSLHSAPSSNATTIVFRNRRSDRLTIYWLDTTGQRQHYDYVPGGGSTGISTYVGHIWLVADINDRCQAIFAANAIPSNAAEIR
jgi:hypothetical protein